MRAGRACRRDRMVRSLKAELDRDITGGEIDDTTGDEERRDTARTFVGKHERGLGDAFDAANTRPDHHAGCDLVFVLRWFPAGMLDRLARGAHRVDDEVVDPALLLRLHPLIGIIRAVRTVTARNLASDFCRE